MILIVIVTAVYLSLTLIIGLWKLRNNNYDSFVSSRSQFSGTILTVSILGTVVGGGMFFTVAQAGFEAGIAFLALPFAYVIGYVLLIRCIPAVRKYLLDADGHTIYDVLRLRLGPAKRATTWFVRMVAIVYFGMYFFLLAGQFTILAGFYQHILSMSVGMSWLLTLGVIGASTMVYSVVGGIKKDIMTDAFQFAAVFIGMIVTGFYLLQHKSEITGLPATHWTMLGYGVSFPIAVLLFFSPSFVARFDYWQRIIAARTEKDAKRALWLSIPVVVMAYTVFCGLGMYTRAIAPAIDPSDAAIVGMKALLPPSAYAIVIMALYAAVMSTSDTLLNVSSVSLVSAIRGADLVKAESKQRALFQIRVTTILVGVSASLLVIFASNTVDLIVAGFSSIVILAPSLAHVLFSKHPSHRAVIFSLGTGYLTFLAIFLLVPPLRKSAFAAGTTIACLPIAVAWLVCRTRKDPSKIDSPVEYMQH